MLRTSMLALGFALAAMPAAPAAPLSLSLSAAIAQGGADPNQAIFADYVQRAIDTLPGQTLPEYWLIDHALLESLLSNIDTLSGLTPGDLWCAAGMKCFVACDGYFPVAEFVGGSGWPCSSAPMPLEIYSAAEQAAVTHQSAGSLSLYIVFYNLVDSVGPYAFPISQPGWYSGGDPFCTAAPNSVGSGARISSVGTPCISANDLMLSAVPVPDQLGLFFLGTTLVLQQPFGDGFRCTGGSLIRLPLEQASGGVLAHAVDFTDPASPASALTAGSTRYVQAWYRDPASGGAGFNLSDGLTLYLYP